MHTGKVMMLAVSLLGITAVASFAHEGPKCPQTKKPQAVHQHKNRTCQRYDGKRQVVKPFGRKHAGHCGQAMTSKQRAAKERWQKMAPAQRQAMKAKGQQWRQRWQKMTPAERKAAKSHMQKMWQRQRR